MSDSDLQFTITADASGVGQGTDQAKSAIVGLGSTLSGVQSAFSGFSAAVAKAFVAPSVGGLTGAMGQVRTGCSDLAGSMGQAGQSMRTWAAETTAAKSTALSDFNVSSVVQGVDRIKSTLGGVQPSIAGFTKSFDGVSSKIKDAFAGASSALNGLKVAGQAGASGLAGLAQIGGGAAAAIAAVVGIALSAADAMAQWADRTKDSSTATTSARQNAAALSSAMNAAGRAFGQVGDTVADAFAPVMSAVVADLTSMAQAFENSYSSGGLAKTALDLLVTGANQLVGAIGAVVDWWKLESDAASGVGQAGSNALTLLTRLVQDLRNALASVLSPAFTAVQTSASNAWNGIQSSFDGLLKGVATGYDKWTGLTQPLVEAIRGIGGAFDVVKSTVRSAFQSILDWIGRLAGALIQFLEKLPGVSDAFETLRTGIVKSLGDARNDLGSLGGEVKQLAIGATPPAAIAASPVAAPKPPAPVAHGALGSTAGAGGPKPCDPSAAQACLEAQTGAQTAADGQRVASSLDASDKIDNKNKQVDEHVIAGVGQQTAVAKAGDAAKTDSSDRSTRHIAANDRKLVETLKSSVDSMVSTFTKGMLEMAERTKSFSQVMRSMGQQLLNDMLKVIDAIVEKWVWGETEKLLASTQGQALLNALGLKDLAAQILIEAKKTEAVVSGATAQTAAKSSAAAAGAGPQIVNALQALKADAAQVFGNVFAWMTSNPVTAPAAPAAAAAASAAVMAVPFAIGTNFVPADTLAYVHQGERILPKADNAALMGALGALHGIGNVAPTTYRAPGQSLGASSSMRAGGPWGRPGATNHNTLVYSPQVTPQKDFRKDLQDHASDVFALLQRGIRDGVLKV